MFQGVYTMLKKSLITLLTISVFGLGFIGCEEEETPPPPPKVQKPKARVEMKVPKFKKMDVSTEKKPISLDKKSNSLDEDNIVQPGKFGSYVLQVGISPEKAQAKRLRNKLRAEGFKRVYIVKVENPGELDPGTYYRVRIGNFKAFSNARIFGHRVLKAKGIPSWIDNKSNDKVGKPEKKNDNDEEYTTASFINESEESNFVETEKEEIKPPSVEQGKKQEIIKETPKGPIDTTQFSEPISSLPGADAVSTLPAAIAQNPPKIAEKVAVSTGDGLKEASSELKGDDWAPANVAPSASDWDDDGWN